MTGPRPFRPPDPLHGVTLEQIVTRLADAYGWAELGQRIPIRCFTSDPSVASSLKFLRRTPWARVKVEALYLATLRQQEPEV
ncbi:VF530 family DNA-binding protein [Deinococcus sp.]|uniref:VF530 family protein n=1 Tax=Deinococcus sp. TaxID=47478 RepID=UPI003CC64DD4